VSGTRQGNPGSTTIRSEITRFVLALAALHLFGVGFSCSGRNTNVVTKPQKDLPNTGEENTATDGEKNRFNLISEGSRAYQRGDSLGARQFFAFAARDGNLPLRTYPISDSVSVVPVDELILKAVEELIGKADLNNATTWLDLQNRYVVVNRAFAEKIAAKFFPLLSDTTWFVILPCLLVLDKKTAMRISDKLGLEGDDIFVKLSETQVKTLELENNVYLEESSLRKMEGPIVSCHNRQRMSASLLARRKFVADFKLYSYNGREYAFPLMDALEEGYSIDFLITSEEEDYSHLFMKLELRLVQGISRIIHSIADEEGQLEIPIVDVITNYCSIKLKHGGGVLIRHNFDDGQTVWFWAANAEGPELSIQEQLRIVTIRECNSSAGSHLRHPRPSVPKVRAVETDAVKMR